jgi:hypothetical protein
MNEFSASVVRVGLSSWLGLAVSDTLHVVFIMATNFVLTVSGLQSLFMSNPRISLSIAWWSFSSFHIPHRPFYRRRESPFHGLVYRLRLWDIPSPSGPGLPVEDAQFKFQALSQGCYQE